MIVSPSEMNRIVITQKRRFINFGWWYHEKAGRFRRIPGQGLEQHKKYDHLPMTENPVVAKGWVDEKLTFTEVI